MHRTKIAVAVLRPTFSLFSLARADIETQPQCGTIVHALEAKDADNIRESLDVVGNTFWNLDEIHMQNGESGIVAQWTDKAMFDNEFFALDPADYIQK